MIGLVGCYFMVQSVLLVPLASAHAAADQQLTPANPNWCSEVPASPAPPHFDGHHGTWAAARKKCTSATREIYLCGDLCAAAKDLWNMQKAGVFNRTDTQKPVLTDQAKGQKVEAPMRGSSLPTQTPRWSN